MVLLLAGMLLAPGLADAGIVEKCRDASGETYFTDQGCRPLKPIERPTATPLPPPEPPVATPEPVAAPAAPATPVAAEADGTTIEPAVPAEGSTPSPVQVTEPSAAADPPGEVLRQRTAQSAHLLPIALGLLVATGGHLWMMGSAFAAGSWVWGLLIFFTAPLGNLGYFLVNLRDSRIAASFALLLAGSALVVWLYVPATDLIDVRESYLTAKTQTTLEERHPRETFRPSETVHLKTVLYWDDWTVKLEPYFVLTWVWYTGDDEIGSYETELEFGDAPQVLEGFVPAKELGSGKHRVELYVDGELFDTREFEVL